jgi:hypothetical protein
MNHIARASVTDSNPQGACVNSDTQITLELPSVGEVIVKTTGWIGQDGMSLNGRISMNGTVVFEKNWRK